VPKQAQYSSNRAKATKLSGTKIGAANKHIVNVRQTNMGSTCRTSKLQKLDEVLRKRLLQSRLLQENWRISKANEEILAAIREATKGQLNVNQNRSCHDAARKMEDILFSASGAERVVRTLQYFKDRAAVQEAVRARDMMVGNDATGASDKYLSKEEKLSAIVMNSLTDFLGQTSSHVATTRRKLQETGDCRI